MNLATPTWIAGLMACGMGVALLGSVKIALAKRLQMDEARVGGLVSMFGFAMIPVMLAMGFLTDLLDKRIVVVAGSFLMVASLLVLARSIKYWSALVAVLLLSAGWSALVNVLNVLMQSAFGGTQTYAMNLGNFFFGLGAFLTPHLELEFLFARQASTLQLGGANKLDIGDLPGRGIVVRRQDPDSVAHPARGNREHPAQLTAAQDADHGTWRDDCTHSSHSLRTWLRC